MKKFLFLSLAIFLINPFSVYAQKIRVLLERDKKSNFLEVRGRFKVYTYDFPERKKRKIIFTKSKTLKGRIYPDAKGIFWAGYSFPYPVIEIEPSGPGKIYFNKRRLLGNFRILNKEQTLNFINVLDLEDYLKGVLPKEMPFWWPLEALKAQAVVARSYAYYKMQANKENYFDLLSTTLSQAYGGKSSQRFKTDLAVHFTKGKVILHNHRPFPAYYHSCCGGHLEDGKFFSEEVSWLKGKTCPFCKNTRFYSWKRRVSKFYLINKLRQRGYFLKDIKDMKIAERSPSGRALVIEITKETSSKFTLLARDLRIILGNRVLLSNLYNLALKGGFIYFKGRGWGHGVGMCQWGAYGMAKRGYNYRKILDFYYPGTILTNLSKLASNN